MVGHSAPFFLDWRCFHARFAATDIFFLGRVAKVSVRATDFFEDTCQNKKQLRPADDLHRNGTGIRGDPMNPSDRIDELIAKTTDWRGKTLADIRKRILTADREIIEEWKWMGSPVWSHDGIIAVATVLKEKVKLTFANGAKLPDPDKLFNAGLKGNAWRAIDSFEGDKINDRALKTLIRAAVDFNRSKMMKKAGTRPKANKSKKR
jgi:hypothetical protein